MIPRFFTEIVGTSLLTLEGQEHHVQRRLCNSAFKLPELHRKFYKILICLGHDIGA